MKLFAGECRKTGYKSKDAEIGLKVIWDRRHVTNFLMPPLVRISRSHYPILPLAVQNENILVSGIENPNYISMFREPALLPREVLSLSPHKRPLRCCNCRSS